MAEKKTSSVSKTSDDLIKDALERFDESQDGSDFNRQAAEEDIRFARIGDQWPKNIAKIRQEEGRPYLTINRLPAYIRHVVNQSRQNKQGIKITPVDNGADVETAEVISGIIRSIERGGDGADVAYDTAIDHAVTNGFGFFRIGIDYAHEDSFNLKAFIERVPNPLMVHWDVNSTKFDASDWGYAFVSEMMTEEEYKKAYPGHEMVDFENDYRATSENWSLEANQVRIAEYWLREENKRTLLQLSDGTVIREDSIPKLAKKFLEDMQIDVGGQVKDDELISLFMESRGVEEQRRREVDFHEVKRRVINGVEVLEEEPWPGSMIPICPVWGEEVYSDGRRHFRSMIRDAKDPQKMFNFWRSASTELVALAPRAPWLAEEGSIPKGQESKWQTANTRSHPVLMYSKGTNMPQRQPFAGVPGGAVNEAISAATDIQEITNIFPSAIGEKSNETSGVAIGKRERQSDNSNFHFLDNLSRAIRYAGRVLVEIIPSVYSPQETIRILGEDMKEKVIKLTQEDGGAQKDGLNGEDRLYNISVGHYDVTVSEGPSFSTQREETRETLVEIMSRVEGAAPLVGDVLMEHMDFQGADKIAKRLRTLLPPSIQDSEAEDGEESLPPEAKAIIAQGKQQMQQMQGQMQEMGKALQEAERNKNDKTQEAQAKGQALQQKDSVDRAKLELDRAKLTLEERKVTVTERQMDLEEAVAEHKAKADLVDQENSAVKTAFDIVNAEQPEPLEPFSYSDSDDDHVKYEV